jgi:hypothetical protein
MSVPVASNDSIPYSVAGGVMNPTRETWKLVTYLAATFVMESLIGVDTIKSRLSRRLNNKPIDSDSRKRCLFLAQLFPALLNY